VFDVPFGADLTQKVTVPLPFNQLDNVIEVILSNINVPSDKKASFTVDFEGCAKRKYFKKHQQKICNILPTKIKS
jgi:hypothetical protein